jgi:hypothetical protein
MSSKSDDDSPFPDSDALASRTEQQQDLYEEAKNAPDRVIPAMFIEDCARCEELAVHRQQEGFYQHFYSTLPDNDSAGSERESLPEALTSAGEVHQAIDSETLNAQDSSTATVADLWESIGTGDHPGKLCQPPLLHYVDREDCYIHAEPTRVGFSYGLPVFIYKRRQSDTRYDTFCAGERVYLWLCGWILHINEFFQPKDFVPRLFFNKVADPSVVNPKLVSKAEEVVFNYGFPGVDNPDITDLPDGINLMTFQYHKDLFADKLSEWRQLYFGERPPQGCGDCEVCEHGVLDGTGPWRPIR